MTRSWAATFQIEDLEDIVGPVGEQLPILRRGAEQRADDRDRVLAGDLGDDLAASGPGVAVDKLVDHVDDHRAQSLGGAGGEGFGHQSPQPVVCGAIEADQVLGDAVP